MSDRRVVIEFASDKALEEFVSDARAHHARDLTDGHRDHGLLLLSSTDFRLVEDCEPGDITCSESDLREVPE